MRDVNTPMLAALIRDAGAEAICFGIVPDDEALLRKTVERALADCDLVILSGGSSAGVKDAAARVVESVGELLMHGVAVRPGKPTLLGRAGNKPLVGLPGHPAAAFFMARLFVLPLLARLEGRKERVLPVRAELSERVSADHGRMQLCACRLEDRDGRLIAVPVRSKSGLVSQLAGTDGFFAIERDCEGLEKGAQVDVYLK